MNYLNRLKLISGEQLRYEYSWSVEEAIKLESEKWIRNLAPFAKNKVLYEELEPNEREVILQYINYGRKIKDERSMDSNMYNNNN